MTYLQNYIYSPWNNYIKWDVFFTNSGNEIVNIIENIL